MQDWRRAGWRFRRWRLTKNLAELGHRGVDRGHIMRPRVHRLVNPIQLLLDVFVAHQPAPV